MSIPHLINPSGAFRTPPLGEAGWGLSLLNYIVFSESAYSYLFVPGSNKCVITEKMSRNPTNSLSSVCCTRQLFNAVYIHVFRFNLQKLVAKLLLFSENWHTIVIFIMFTLHFLVLNVNIDTEVTLNLSHICIFSRIKE